MNHHNSPIGVFDSGLGGLTVVKALMRLLPREDIVYFGDTARVPYGTKSRSSIIRFSLQNAEILKKFRVKMIVVACNSSSAHALGPLKRVCRVPVIGVITPGVKRALCVTKNKRIGVIATPATVNSRAYDKQLKKYDRYVKVIHQACPLFVPLVEEGWFNKPVTITAARTYLQSIKRSRADTLILGCTHYPLLKTVLRKIMGLRVTLVDSAREVAREVKGQLQASHQACNGQRKGRCRFLVSDEPDHFRTQAKRFLGTEVKAVKRVNEKGLSLVSTIDKI